MAKKKVTKKTPLTPKQELFCKEYIIDLNATQAYKRAGYKVSNENSAGASAGKLLQNPKIDKKINELKKAREEKLEVNAEWVLKEAVEIYQMAKGDIEQKVSYRAKGGKAQEIKMKKTNLREATKALEIIGKHVSVKAFEKEIDLGDNMIFTITLPDELKE